MSDVRVQYMSSMRYEKSLAFIKNVLSIYDDKIHEKLIFEIVPCSELLELQKEVKTLKEVVKYLDGRFRSRDYGYIDNLGGFQKKGFEDITGKILKELRGKNE